MSSAETTTNHDEIRNWVEARGGTPTKVKDTGGEVAEGLLRIDFGERDASLEAVSWDEFFAIFEENDRAFLHQDRTEDGSQSRFLKFVSRKDGG